jgi:hypothetical protein
MIYERYSKNERGFLTAILSDNNTSESKDNGDLMDPFKKVKQEEKRQSRGGGQVSGVIQLN